MCNVTNQNDITKQKCDIVVVTGKLCTLPPYSSIYLSQSNDNAQCVDEQDRFKFVDDLSFLEVIYLLTVGITSYNIHAHVPSNIPTHNQVIVGNNLNNQSQLNSINDWTKK